jgi:hypothetical protein
MRTNKHSRTMWISFFLCVLALSSASAQESRPSVSAPIRMGAIRWDAWYVTTPGTPGAYVVGNLTPRRYRARLPFCAAPASGESITAGCDSQASFDREIAYATKAGIRYWAYVWYNQNSPMLQAWKRHQASQRGADINWTMISGFRQFDADMHEQPGSWSPGQYVRWFRQSNFEKIDSRPLLFLLGDPAIPLRDVAGATNILRSAAAKAGMQAPYVVVMSSNIGDAVQSMAAIGADAISSYNGIAPEVQSAPYSMLDQDNRSFWAAQATAGRAMVPTGSLGWDRRPRIERPVPWEASYQAANAGLMNFYQTATPAELATHVQAMLSWMKANPAATPSHHALLYAWNEFDEGGWLEPTYTAQGPDSSRISALAAVLKP